MQMNTEAMQPNQLETAKKQMSKFLSQIDVPETINTSEKHLMHVVIVEGNFNQQTLETVYKAKVQTYDDRSWNVVEGRLKQLGYSHVYLIHDPRVQKEEKTEETATKIDRDALIAKAVELGWEGAKNLKNQVYIDFIMEVEEANEGDATAIDESEGVTEE